MAVELEIDVELLKSEIKKISTPPSPRIQVAIFDLP